MLVCLRLRLRPSPSVSPCLGILHARTLNCTTRFRAIPNPKLLTFLPLSPAFYPHHVQSPPSSQGEARRTLLKNSVTADATANTEKAARPSARLGVEVGSLDLQQKPRGKKKKEKGKGSSSLPYLPVRGSITWAGGWLRLGDRAKKHCE
jgi:hypothetical protein